MKLMRLSFLLVLSGFIMLASCKKKDTTPALKAFSFPTTTDLVVEMSWKANDSLEGDKFVDLDLYVADTSVNTNNYSSTNSDGFENITIPTSALNKDYYVGVEYFDNFDKYSLLTSPVIITYTFKVYPTGSPLNAQTFTGTLNPSDTSYHNTTPDIGKIHYQMKLTKSAATYSFAELATKFIFTY